MWELGHKEGWVLKNWCFWTVVLEKTLESPLDCKEIQPVHPKGIQSWIFIGRTDAEAEIPILWPPDVKSWLIWIDPNAGKDWRQEEKGTTEDEMVGWHHWLDGHGFGWTPGVGDGQGGLACCNSWGLQRVGHDWVTELNWVISGLLAKVLKGNLNTDIVRVCLPHLFYVFPIYQGGPQTNEHLLKPRPLGNIPRYLLLCSVSRTLTSRPDYLPSNTYLLQTYLELYDFLS